MGRGAERLVLSWYRKARIDDNRDTALLWRMGVYFLLLLCRAPRAGDSGRRTIGRRFVEFAAGRYDRLIDCFRRDAASTRARPFDPAARASELVDAQELGTGPASC